MGQTGAPEPFYVEIHGHEDGEISEPAAEVGRTDSVKTTLRLTVVGISPLALFRSSDVTFSTGKPRDERENREEKAMSNMTDNLGESVRRTSWHSPNRPPDGIDVGDVVTTENAYKPGTFRKTKVQYLWGDSSSSDYGKLTTDWSLDLYASMSWKTKLLWEASSWTPCFFQCSKWEMYDYSVIISEEHQNLKANIKAKSGASTTFPLRKKELIPPTSIYGTRVNFYLISFNISLSASLYAGGDVSFTGQFNVDYTRTFSRSGMEVSKRKDYSHEHSLGRWNPPTDQLDWGSSNGLKVSGELEIYLEARFSVSLMSGAFWDSLKAGISAYMDVRLYVK